MNAITLKAAKLTASLLIGFCAYGFLTSAHAAESRMAPIQVEGMLQVDCAAPRVPGQQEIARAFEVANFSKTYDLRQQIQHVATRACHSGADRVLFSRDDSQRDEDALRYVAMND